jgi:ABC-2 type transport system ATP-binding protein
MVQRLAMAQCFLGEPELALLDEPMSGLDPAGRQLMTDLIGELRAEGATVLFSTHVPADLERCATGLVVLKEGRATKLPLADLNDAAGLLEEFYGACRAG